MYRAARQELRAGRACGLVALRTAARPDSGASPAFVGRGVRGAGCGVKIVGEGERGLQLEPGPTRRGPRGNFDELHFRNFSLLEERSTPRELCTPLIVLLMNTDVSQGRVGAGCGGSIERRAICVIGKVRCRSLIVSFIRFVRFCWRRNSNTFHSFK